MRPARLPALLAALLVPAVAGAQQETITSTHFSMSFCWERNFTTAELAAAPGQELSRLRLGPPPIGALEAPGETVMAIEATFRAADGGRMGDEATAVGACREDGAERFRCGLEGQIGTYAIQALGWDAILLTPGERGVTFETRRGERELPAGDGAVALELRRCS